MADPSPLNSQQKMADAILRDRLDTTLGAFLEAHRTQGLTYEAIAQELYASTDRAVSVSYQTIKRWLDDFGLLEVAS